MQERRNFGRGHGFRGRERENRYRPKPVEVGKEYEVDVQETSRRGEGVARIQDLVIFIPNTKPGDHAKIKIERISSRFAEAEVIEKGESTETSEEKK